jgi:hypothetical protein
MLSIILIVAGSAIALFTSLWWKSEVAGRVGDGVASEVAFQCLRRLGTGDCEKLWLVGLHQSNQIAGLLFYGGIVLAAAGLLWAISRVASRRG